jgi:formamidopyrimidine-DNA glycosylase
MPELPEVETMVRGLRPAMVGTVLEKIDVLDSFLLHGCSPADLCNLLENQKVKAIHRRGKWVLIEVEPGPVLVIEPRMTGGFWLVPPDRPEHARVNFQTTTAPYKIWFCDTRRLGRIRLYKNLAEASEAIAKSQAEDALVITFDQLANRLRKTSRPIKPTLMDQKIVSGVGNIYADEILFASRVHPERISASLKANEIQEIHQNMSLVLNRAIEAEGTSFDAGYRTVLGLEGGFLAINAMYGHGGKPCPECQTPIVKTQIAGLLNRPTHYCPECQKLPKMRKKKPDQ